MSKIILASGVMAVFLWIPMRLLDQFVFDTTRTVPLIVLTVIAGLTGSGMYLALARWLAIPEYRAYTKLLKRLGTVHKWLWTSEEILETPTQTQEIKPL
jgi:predicted PurR-regulated permease PerM